MGRAHLALAITVASLLAAAPVAAAAPDNDAPASATVISAVPGEVSGSTADATMEINEPPPLALSNQGGTGLDRSVWYSYVPPTSMKLLVDTCEANFSSHIDVYSGDIGELKPVATTDNSYEECAGDRRSFEMTKDVRYLIRVTALRDRRQVPPGGVFRLALTPQIPPANDAFTRATPLTTPGVTKVSLAFSSIEFGEPLDESETGSVWYRLTPGSNVPYVAEIAPTPFETTLSVYQSTGRSINRLQYIDTDYADSDHSGSVAFNALRHHRYYLQVLTDSQVPAPVTLTLTTNTAAGLGLIATLLRNSVSSVRKTGLRASLSCARTCTLGVDLLIAPRDVRRYHLIKKWRKAKAPLRVGHVGGTLQTRVPQTVTIPITSRGVRHRLQKARLVHFLLRIHVRGRAKTKPLTKVVLVRRRASRT